MLRYMFRSMLTKKPSLTIKNVHRLFSSFTFTSDWDLAMANEGRKIGKLRASSPNGPSKDVPSLKLKEFQSYIKQLNDFVRLGKKIQTKDLIPKNQRDYDLIARGVSIGQFEVALQQAEKKEIEELNEYINRNLHKTS